MNFTDFRTAMIQMLVITDPYGQQMFDALLPRIIDYAELRCYREPVLDFLATRTANAGQQTTPGVRTVSMPDTFVVVENVNLLTPANTNLDSPTFSRIPLLRATREFLDQIWPNPTEQKTPARFETYYAIYSQQELPEEGIEAIPNQIIIAPTPDNQYTVEVLGTFRPAPLSEANPETFLSIHLPDLYLSAAMVFSAGSLLKNYGAQADDPKMAVSWEAVYQQQLQTSGIESLRQKAAVGGMSVRPPNPTAPNIAAMQAAAQQGS